MKLQITRLGSAPHAEPVGMTLAPALMHRSRPRQAAPPCIGRRWPYRWQGQPSVRFGLRVPQDVMRDGGHPLEIVLQRFDALIIR
jgi:hypothetical protein